MERVIVVGGTGRIGRAVAGRLIESFPGIELVVAGRREDEGQRVAAALGEHARFLRLDLAETDTLVDALSGARIVVNTAGPFQQSSPVLLAAAINAGVDYLDIADDLAFARQARALGARAIEKGRAALSNGGLFPGLSNVMAGALLEAEPADRVEFSYFVAGTGGAGPTVMASTFLLSAVGATEFVDGVRHEHRAFTGRRVVEFPPPIGRRACFYLELPEATSCYETYRVSNVSARFGTAPAMWNYNTRAMSLLPKRFLTDRAKVAGLVRALMPMLRAVDRWVGAAAAMRVDVTNKRGAVRTLRYAHPETVPAIAVAVVEQARELLEGRVRPGVWWPEEGIRDKRDHLRRATAGAAFEETPPQE